MKPIRHPAALSPLILPAVLAGLCLVAANPSGEKPAAPPPLPGIKTGDTLRHAPPGTVRIEGWIGGEIDRTISSRVMAQDAALILKPYQERFEENAGHWRCEYWGKWFLSAALAQSAKPTPVHADVLAQGVAGLLATQTPDGYIGTYKDDKHLGIWDVWGRKYTMLGLIADYDLNGNRESLEAACRVADHLLKLVMCDYASAGNGWSGDNLFRVWLPQPLFLRHAYPADTWRLTCPGAETCPDVPQRTSVKQAAAPAAAPAERQDF